MFLFLAIPFFTVQYVYTIHAWAERLDLLSTTISLQLNVNDFPEIKIYIITTRTLNVDVSRDIK